MESELRKNIQKKNEMISNIYFKNFANLSLLDKEKSSFTLISIFLSELNLIAWKCLNIHLFGFTFLPYVGLNSSNRSHMVYAIKISKDNQNNQI